MNLQELQEKFLTNLRANGRTAATIDTYLKRWRLLPWPPTTSIYDITPDMVDEWSAGLDHLADASRRGYVQSFRALTAFAVRRGYISHDPAIDLDWPSVNHSAKNKVMRLQDLYRLIDTCDESYTGIRDKAIIFFMAGSGARRVEVARLRLDDLDLANREAHVNGKGSEGTVTYPAQTVEQIERWLAVRPETNHDHLFCTSMAPGTCAKGEPLTTNGITQMFKRRAKWAGIVGPANPHAIRHLVGQFYTDHTNLELARQKLRHASVTTTANFYAHQDMTRVKGADELHNPLHGYREEGV